ncbi:MAG: hypothetical protein KF764_07780 [Labilithrix sp.]|nr:hypothetical protein [Labilithrix sp.]
MASLLMVLFVALAVAGCPGPTFVVQQYAGPERPPETIATLRVNGSEAVRLLFLDEQDVAAPIVEDGRLHIEVVPARHTLVVANANAPNERYAPLAFDAEAGKVYRVAFVAGDARVYEVDRGRDALIRDVTVVTPPPRRAPPPQPAPPPPEPSPAPPPEDAGAPTAAADAG